MTEAPTILTPQTGTDTDLWLVAHTRPRCEKKVEAAAVRDGARAILPCYRSVRKYRGKTVVFHKPLFPNYVFIQTPPQLKDRLRQNDHIANLLHPPDPAELERQIGEVLRALNSDLEVRLAPQIQAGTRVRIRTGPLRGVEGWVEARKGLTLVLLRIDFIQQAAAVSIQADDLELI